ncbi:MAG TPA: serine/threonine-protein kinase [Gemmatimonadaceae bacterium]|jgi:serine/threonine-protein kinase
MTFPTAIFDNEELSALRAALGGRYVVERELGRGGMGVVYLAREKSLDRLVALKVLPATLMGQEVLRDRFLRETRLVANMSHPNVVPVYAVEEHPGVILYAMGYIDGESLTERVRRAGPLPPGEVARVLQEAAWALSYAHSRGVVHRDVKPDNILIERATGRALLLDFGISKVADSTMTSLGETLGTPQFMSPEQAAGEGADPRSDLYSLGLVGFFALTGRAPFDGPTVQGILAMQVTQPAPAMAVARPGTPRGLAAAIDRCLAKSPNDRWPTAEALVEALQRARGASVQEIAPPVRNFQRVAEMTLTTVITLFLLIPAVAAARPQATDMLALVIVIFTAINLLQLGSNARRLRDQGFSYEDVRAAFDADARITRDVAAEVVSGQHPLQRLARKRFPVFMAAGVAMFGAGVVLANRVHAQPRTDAVAVGLVLGGALLILGVAILRAFSGDIGRGANRLAVALWRTGAGRLFFRLAAPAKGASAAGAAAPRTSGHAALIALNDLPPALRRQLGDASRVVASLERTVSALDAREGELDRALAEVASAEGGADAAALARDRASLTHDLQRARDGVIAHRDALKSELEHLRLSFVRTRAGVGTAADARASVDRARATVQAAEPQLAPPNGLAVRAPAGSRPA